MTSPIGVTPRHAGIARMSIKKMAKMQRRSLTAAERDALAALAVVVRESPVWPVGKPAPPARRPLMPVPREPGGAFPVAAMVHFKSVGSKGRSPWRDGTVMGTRKSVRGIWIVVAEVGAAPGIVVLIHPSLIMLREEGQAGG